MFFGQTKQVVESCEKLIVVEDAEQDIFHTLPSVVNQLLCRRLVALHELVECHHLRIHGNGTRWDLSAQHHSFERSATRQGHINLSGTESAVGLDDGMVEGQALALVNSDGPGCLQRNLLEDADHFFGDCAGLRVGRIFRVRPFLFGHLYHLVVIVRSICIGVHRVGTAFYKDTFGIAFHYASDFAIVILMIRVVLAEHHLCADLQCQFDVGGIRHFRELAFDSRFILNRLGRQLHHSHRVDVGSLVVVGRQGDVSLLVLWLEIRDDTRIECCQCFASQPVVTHLIK